MKTVIEMARIAGARDDGQRFEFELRDLEFLVALVRLDEREKWEGQTAVEVHEAVLDEREACVKAADDQWVRNPKVSGGDAIRARGKT